MANSERLTAVSLFSGCGGSDLGAKQAGVDVIMSNDCYAPAVQTYKKYKDIIASSNTEILGTDVRAILHFPPCDLLLGCYPCQSFTMGGNRTPEKDERTTLYLEFLRCLKQTNPKFFIAENVAGMQWLEGGKYLFEQIKAFSEAGKQYIVSVKILDAKEFGVPADRKRIFIVGIRRDLEQYYWFPEPNHGPNSPEKRAYVSHGETIRHLPINCPGDFYHDNKEPFSWWFLSRNRKRNWHSPAYTVVSNWRHCTLHPASPTMKMIKTDWRDGSKQWWEFSDEYEHTALDPTLPVLEEPRRLSWRECALLQTFPAEIEPVGSIEAKFWQIGNAVPPLLMKHIVEQITSGRGLKNNPSPNYITAEGYQVNASFSSNRLRNERKSEF